MKKISILAIIVIFSGTIAVMVAQAQKQVSEPVKTAVHTEGQANAEPTTEVPVQIEEKKSIVDLPVPHIWEIPDGVWVNPWANACEESAIVMVEEYYFNRGKVIIPKKEVKTKLPVLFNWENKVFGSNADSDSKRTARIINEYSSFEAIIKEYPTLDEIKAELAAGHPVITFHYAKGMNENHRFAVNGSYYHVMVLTGYNDEKQEFTVNDSEFENGLDHPYSYDVIMDSLHDFDHARRKADGPPVVIFTRSKQIVKAEGKSALYLIQNNKKHYISHPSVFKNRRWNWNTIKTVDAEWLNSLPNGPIITK